MIKHNLELIRQNITDTCDKCGRSKDDVTLIAVSKTKPVSMLKECYDAGVRDFGENKVQEIIEKYDQMPKDVRWHMIGHLQRNKVKYIIDKKLRWELRDILDQFNINERMIYPGKAGIAKWLARHYYVKSK